MANLPTLSCGTLSEFRIARRIRNVARAGFPYVREFIVWPVRLVLAAGVLLVAERMHDARAMLPSALPPVAGGGPLLASAAGILFALAAVLWLRTRKLDARIRQLAAAIENHGVEALPDAPVERGAPSIARLTRAINDAHRQHAERVTELLHVLAAYAHDLRTPLTRMMLRSGMLEDGALRDAMERDLAEMGELVEASLACARLQCSVAEPPRRVDADELLGALVGNYRDAGLTVGLDGRVGHPLVTCPHALRRVLVNLIDNALRYGGDVRLCVRVDARRVMLSVVDSGPGIVPAELEAVFAPWYRAPQTAARASGSGLGLAIARRLTQAMQGELQLNNRSTGGLEARVTLPLAVA
ncbi:sensor histidine kinase [Burkholderia sp. MS455]|uniref:histidine kinase n=1 Tax=Burkholderia pyrrocinia TaxID=60550 RepID=A0A318HWC9_BURPY|nr:MULTISPECIES: ATP-binding protein [Burkholderia]PXX22543.1 signal transduction histidine kinase [Burkholderia pyrrocinia]QRR05575.1 sensor histidine kinase [Burkholderia sp. MS455]SFW46806.1 Signal transduction histidine kinase [Burkholderia sp. NFACC33-1]SFY04789.1 Signal transduction histidine kinase [Burkholderia sp. NFPP32]